LPWLHEAPAGRASTRAAGGMPTVRVMIPLLEQARRGADAPSPPLYQLESAGAAAREVDPQAS
jgi:hypothetical protein